MKAKLFILLLMLVGVGGVMSWWLQSRRAEGQIVLVTQPPPDWTVPELAWETFQPRVAEMLQRAREQLNRDLGSSKSWFLYGATLDAHKLGPQAEHCYRHALVLDPTDHYLVYNFGVLIEQAGDRPDEANHLYQKATELMPDYPPVWYRIGRLRARQGQYDEAEVAYRRAIDLHGDLAAAQYGLGQTLVATGKLLPALVHLERAARLMPEDASTQAALARAYTQSGDLDRAAAASARAATREIKLSFSDPARDGIRDLAMDSNAFFQRGRRHAAAGRHQQAIGEFEVAAQFLTRNPSLFLQLGVAHFNIGQDDRAAPYLVRVTELREDLSQANLLLGMIHVRGGRPQEAAERYRLLLQREPEHPRGWALLGAAQVMMDQPGEALASFERAMSMGDPQATDLIYWGNALETLDRLDEAESRYRQALSLDPASQGARDRLRALTSPSPPRRSNGQP